MNYQKKERERERVSVRKCENRLVGGIFKISYI